jgi:hypothetical protein
MEKNSRQDPGSLGAHIAGQTTDGVQLPDGFSGRCRNRRLCAGAHPGDHSLTEQNDESETAAGRLTEHVLSQLLVPNCPVFSGHGPREHFVHRGFF